MPQESVPLTAEKKIEMLTKSSRDAELNRDVGAMTLPIGDRFCLHDGLALMADRASRRALRLLSRPSIYI